MNSLKDLLSLDDPFLASPTPPTASVLFDTGEETDPESSSFDDIWARLEKNPLTSRARGWAICNKKMVIQTLDNLGYTVEQKENAVTAEGKE